jgi:hypothetical protein
MCEDQASSLRKAIENLISAKLFDMMARPGGLDRLVAHRMTGVASHDVRNAEQQLERALGDLLPQTPQRKSRCEKDAAPPIHESAPEPTSQPRLNSAHRPTGHARVPAGV